MMTFAAGLVVGLALGLVTVGFLAIAAYQRGYAEAAGQRKQWRAELVARRAAVRLSSSAPVRVAPPQAVASAPVAQQVPQQVPAVASVATRKAS